MTLFLGQTNILFYSWIHLVLFLNIVCFISEYILSYFWIYFVLFLNIFCFIPEYILFYFWIYFVLFLNIFCININVLPLLQKGWVLIWNSRSFTHVTMLDPLKVCPISQLISISVPTPTGNSVEVLTLGKLGSLTHWSVKYIY